MYNFYYKQAIKIEAKIIETPRNLKIYCGMILRRLKELSKKIIEKTSVIEDYEGFNNFLNESLLEDDYYFNNVLLKNLNNKIEVMSDIITSIINEINNSGDPIDYLRSYESVLDSASKEISKQDRIFERKITDNKDNMDRRVDDNDTYNKTNDWSEYRTVLYDLLAIQKEFLSIILSDQEKIREIFKILREQEAYKPETEDIEILYHTSIFAWDIFKNGFKKDFNRENEGLGLGGSTSSSKGKPTISFTHDMRIAKEIKRCLKEAIMIAKGEIKYREVSDWAKRENLLEDIFQIYGYPNRKGVDRMNDPAYIFNIYRGYLALTKTRYNPLFFGDPDDFIKNFKRVNSSDVGILVCKVNLKNDNIEYLRGEREYRVPVEAIINIEKII